MKNRRLAVVAAIGATISLAVSVAPATGAGARHDDDHHGHHHGHYYGHHHGHHGHHYQDRVATVVDSLDGPRGIDALGHGRTLVTEIDGTFNLVVQRRHHPARVIELGQVETTFSPAIAAGRHGWVWLLTGGAAPEEPTAENSATLYKWRWGWDEPVAVADIAAYQQTDPDPYDLEDFPEDSNPFGLVALRDGTLLVSDAAGNDLLHVWPDGKRIETVARLMPRMVETPEGLPGAGTDAMAEAVATSVTVGRDGYWYVGELRGYPGTPGTSEIWRIRPGTTDATCDPEHPWTGSCRRYADGLTSIVDLGASRYGILAVTLSKLSWLAAESDPPIEGAEIGGLFLVHHHRIHELVRDQLTLPGGVDVSEDGVFVVGPVFGPGSLMKLF